MTIPTDIKKALDEGIVCPLCEQGDLELEQNLFHNDVKCNKCGKKVIIHYLESPFKIIKIVEDEILRFRKKQPIKVGGVVTVERSV
jgi:DNA-directed RNA polymerase subunit RPC12/RpoP